MWALAKRYFSMYKQIQVTTKIRNRTKLLQLSPTSALKLLNIKPYHKLVTNHHANTPFFCLSSFITGTLTPMPQNFEKAQTRLIKKVDALVINKGVILFLTALAK